jgi:hypothetical protein
LLLVSRGRRRKPADQLNQGIDHVAIVVSCERINQLARPLFGDGQG